jgi:hypothetical protein
MEKSLEKDAGILLVLAQLRASLGEDAFDVVDHWEADLTAVGIANPRNHSVLVYLSNFNRDQGHYDVELELPPTAKEDEPYRIAGNHWNVGFNEVIAIVREHLSRA